MLPRQGRYDHPAVQGDCQTITWQIGLSAGLLISLGVIHAFVVFRCPIGFLDVLHVQFCPADRRVLGGSLGMRRKCVSVRPESS